MHVDLSYEPIGFFKTKIEDFVKVPKVITINKFDDESAKEFNKEFSEALNTGQSVIPLIIDSYGGECYSLLNMVDTIKNSPVPVATIVKGKAMSCGVLLLSCGVEGMRYAAPNADLMIHEVSWGTFGKSVDMENDADHVKRLNKKFFNMLNENCKKPNGYFDKIYKKEKERANWYLDSKEAKKHNIVNHIGIPEFKISIKVSTEIV